MRPPLLPTRQRVDERVGEKAGAALGRVHDEHGETGGGVVSGGRKDDGPLRAEGKKADEGHPHSRSPQMKPKSDHSLRSCLDESTGSEGKMIGR